MNTEAHEALREKLSERVKRLHLSACVAELPTLRRVGVELALTRCDLAELLETLGPTPAGLAPSFLASLRVAYDHSAPQWSLKLRMSFGDFMALLGAALRSGLSDGLARGVGLALGGVAEGLDAMARHTAEVLSLISTDILESLEEPPCP